MGWHGGTHTGISALKRTQQEKEESAVIFVYMVRYKAAWVAGESLFQIRKGETTLTPLRDLCKISADPGKPFERQF